MPHNGVYVVPTNGLKDKLDRVSLRLRVAGISSRELRAPLTITEDCLNMPEVQAAYRTIAQDLCCNGGDQPRIMTPRHVFAPDRASINTAWNSQRPYLMVDPFTSLDDARTAIAMPFGSVPALFVVYADIRHDRHDSVVLAAVVSCEPSLLATGVLKAIVDDFAAKAAERGYKFRPQQFYAFISPCGRVIMSQDEWKCLPPVRRSGIFVTPATAGRLRVDLTGYIRQALRQMFMTDQRILLVNKLVGASPNTWAAAAGRNLLAGILCDA